MKITLLIIAALVGLLVLTGLVLYLLGRSLPERHTSRVSVLLPAARARVWAVITDYPAMPAWWPAVKAVRMETRLTVTEDGFIKPPLFRVVAQYFLGLDGTLKDFAANLRPRVAAR